MAEEKTGHGPSTLPGRPKDAGSRQQTGAGQSAQTGSPATDKDHTRGGGKGAGPKPPGAK